MVRRQDRQRCDSRRQRASHRNRLPGTARLGLSVGAVMLLLTATAQIAPGCVTSMPGRSYSASVAAAHKRADADLARRLESHITVLAQDIGERHAHGRPAKLEAAALYIEKQFRALGYQVNRQVFRARGRAVRNLEITLPGTRRPDEIVVVGAHYDTAPGTPGANDNGSGVAALLELARLFKQHRPRRTLRFVAWVNEEPPYFQTALMGSLVYARRCKKRRENIVGAISLETMGFFSDAPESQQYPSALARYYPRKGNFIAFVGNYGSRALVRRSVKVFRQHARIASEGAALIGTLPGVGYSDHWSFWQQGYDALMVTDTAFFRYEHYHKASDTVDKVDVHSLALVVTGLVPVLHDLTTP